MRLQRIVLVRKTWNLQNPEISMVRFIYLF